MADFPMQGAQIDWGRLLQSMEPTFNGVRPDASWATRNDVSQTFRQVIQHLPEDLETLRREAGFVFSVENEPENLTEQTVELFRRWHLAKRSPSLAALVIFALENLKPDLPPEIARAVLAAGVLGEVENNLRYHNNLHYKKVILQIMRLITVHNTIYEGTDRALDGRQAGLLLLAACIHDLGHDGKGNTIKGVFEQGRLERRAMDLAQPYFEACGMDARDIAKVRVMILCTDVAPLGDPANPVNQMKAAYRYHFLGQKKKIGPLNLDPDLMPLQNDPVLTMMSLILHEADIGTSAGLDYTITAFETSSYKRELGEERAYPRDIIDFLEDICQRRMLSAAGERLFAANMARIFALAEKEVADGNHAFPVPEYSDFLVLHSAGSGDGSGKTIN